MVCPLKDFWIIRRSPGNIKPFWVTSSGHLSNDNMVLLLEGGGSFCQAIPS